MEKKYEELLPSQSETTIPSIHLDTFKIWNWRVTPSENSCLQHFRILIRERPEIRILSSDLRLHSNWDPSFQEGLPFTKWGKPKSPLYFGISGQLCSSKRQITPLLLQDELTIGMLTHNLLKEKSIPIVCSSSSILFKHSSNAVWQVWNLHSLLSCIYTKYVISFLYSWIQLDHDHRISAYEEKKTILLLPDNLISSDLKFELLQGNQSNLINLKLPLMAVFISLSLLPQGKITDHHRMEREPGPGAALQAPTGLLGRCHPFVFECWPGSADGAGGYLQSWFQPAFSSEAGTVRSVPSSFWPQGSPTWLSQYLHI